MNIKKLINNRIKAVLKPYSKVEGQTLLSGTPKEIIEELSTLIQQQREEAVVEYRINFEKGVQEVVENTIAKDRIAEIKEEAVKEFVNKTYEIESETSGETDKFCEGWNACVKHLSKLRRIKNE